MSSPVTFVASVDDQRRQDGRTWAVMYLGVITVSAALGLIALQSAPRFFSLPLTMLLISSVLVIVKPVAGPYVIAFFAVMSDGVINPWYPFTFGLSNQASVLFVTNSLTISPLELLLILTAVGWLLRLLIDRSSPRPGAGRAVATHGGLHRLHLLRHRRRPRHRWEPVCRHLGVPALPAAAGPVRGRHEPVHDPPSLRVAGRGRAALTRRALRPGAAGTIRHAGRGARDAREPGRPPRLGAAQHRALRGDRLVDDQGRSPLAALAVPCRLRPGRMGMAGVTAPRRGRSPSPSASSCSGCC